MAAVALADPDDPPWHRHAAPTGIRLGMWRPPPTPGRVERAVAHAAAHPDHAARTARKAAARDTLGLYLAAVVAAAASASAAARASAIARHAARRRRAIHAHSAGEPAA